MATFATTIASPRSPQDAFDYMADLRNFAQWDPGVERVEQVTGDGGGSAGVFDVTVEAPVRPLTLRYRTVAFDAPRSITVKASSLMFTSLDTITVEPDGDGCVVRYHAELDLNGPLGLFDRLLQPRFDQIGGRANTGLLRVLDGTQR